MRRVVAITRVCNVLAKVLQQIKDGSPPVPIEILVQAKTKEPPTDAVPKFIEAYSTYTRVATLVKETYHGKLISEWNQGIDKLTNKPEQVDMAPALSTVMAVKDEDELVRRPVDTR
jgi:nucleosome binding factor SPN SPT16 subunit